MQKTNAATQHRPMQFNILSNRTEKCNSQNSYMYITYWCWKCKQVQYWGDRSRFKRKNKKQFLNSTGPRSKVGKRIAKINTFILLDVKK